MVDNVIFRELYLEMHFMSMFRIHTKCIVTCHLTSRFNFIADYFCQGGGNVM